MTQIDFYTHVEDKLGTACKLAAKGYSTGRRMFVCCPDADTAARFDRMLWTTPAIGFIPHCATGDPLASVTPVVVDHGGPSLRTTRFCSICARSGRSTSAASRG